MPSEKLTAILRAKSPFSSDEIVAMSEAEAGIGFTRTSPQKKGITKSALPASIQRSGQS
jgi:hypothetical protein